MFYSVKHTSYLAVLGSILVSVMAIVAMLVFFGGAKQNTEISGASFIQAQASVASVNESTAFSNNPNMGPGEAISIKVSGNDGKLGWCGISGKAGEATLIAHLQPGAFFTGWFENGEFVSAELNYTFAFNRSYVFFAVFSTVQEYTITAKAENNNGIVSGGATVTAGDEIILEAVPNEGYNFVGWEKVGTPDIFSESNSFRLQVNENATFIARFAPITLITIDTFVFSTPESSLNTVQILVAGSDEVSNGVFYQNNGEAKVVATPSEGYIFDGWYENFTLVSKETVFIIDTSRDRTLMALFKEVVVAPAEIFDVEINVVVKDVITRTMTLSFAKDAPVSLDPLSFGLTTFIGWYKGDDLENALLVTQGVSPQNIYNFTSQANTRLFLKLEPKTFVISVVFSGSMIGSGITLYGAGVYEEGAPVRLSYSGSSEAGARYRFESWMEYGRPISNSSEYSSPEYDTTANRDRTFVAVFTVRTYKIYFRIRNQDLDEIIFASDHIYNYGAEVTFNASFFAEIYSGYFLGWTDDLDRPITQNGQPVGNTYTFTVSSNKTINLDLTLEKIMVYVGVYRDANKSADAGVLDRGFAGQFWRDNALNTGVPLPLNLTLANDKGSAFLELGVTAYEGYAFAYWLKNGFLLSRDAYTTDRACYGDIYQAVFTPVMRKITIDVYVDSILSTTYVIDVFNDDNYHTIDALDYGKGTFISWSKNGEINAYIDGTKLVFKPLWNLNFFVSFKSETVEPPVTYTIVVNSYVEVWHFDGIGYNVTYDFIGSYTNVYLAGSIPRLTYTKAENTQYRFYYWGSDADKDIRYKESPDNEAVSVYAFTIGIWKDYVFAMIFTHFQYFVTLDTYPAAAQASFVNPTNRYVNTRKLDRIDLSFTCSEDYQLVHFLKDGKPLDYTASQNTPDKVFIGGGNSYSIFSYFPNFSVSIVAVFEKKTVSAYGISAASASEISMIGEAMASSSGGSSHIVIDIDALFNMIKNDITLSTNNKDAAIIFRSTINGINMLSASARQGYRFIGWEVDGQMVSGEKLAYTEGSGLNVVAIYGLADSGMPETTKWIIIGSSILLVLGAAATVFAVRRHRTSHAQSV